MAENTDTDCRAPAAARLLGVHVGMEGDSLCAWLTQLQQYTVYCSSMLYNSVLHVL